MARLSCVLFGFALFVTGMPAGADPYGPVFQVDTFTSPNLSTPSFTACSDLATGANGDSIALWYSGPNGGTAFIQRYDVVGRALQSQEWNMGAGGCQVAVDGTGNFALLSRLADDSGYGVFVTVYSRSGAVVVPRFRVNDTTLGNQHPVNLTMNALGQFAVTWQGQSTRPGVPLYVKRFHANGAPASAEILLQPSTGASGETLRGSGVALDAAGNFVVSWSYGDYMTVNSNDIWVQRFNAAGVPLGAAFRANTTLPGDQLSAVIAMNEAGAFVVAWDYQASESDSGVYARRFDPGGAPLGGEFRVDVERGGIHEGLDAAMAPDGSFVISWAENAQIVARAYTNAGVALGAPFPVSAPGELYSTTNRMGMDRAGNFVIGWLQHRFTQDPNNAFKARRYSPAASAIQPLLNGQVVSSLSGAANSWRFFKLTVPAGHATVEASTFGGFGDADLYVRWGALPTLDAWDGRPYLDGNAEGVRMLSFPPGDWYIGVNGFLPYGGLGLTAVSR